MSAVLSAVARRAEEEGLAKVDLSNRRPGKGGPVLRSAPRGGGRPGEGGLVAP